MDTIIFFLPQKNSSLSLEGNFGMAYNNQGTVL